MHKHLTIVPLCVLAIACDRAISIPTATVSPQLQTVANNSISLKSIAAKANYTGVVKKVDAIAQQITVRIEDKNGGNGSGVIVAKEGDTYYVATAAHVVQTKKDGEKKKIAVELITPTQEKITLQEGDINIINQDLDVAIVKFKSKQNYRIADIGKYEFNKSDWVFVSGFPGKDTSKQRHLSIGRVQKREETEFRVKDRSSLSSGRNLIYTNLSLPGMSGGAVLDRQGRLVGINTGAENQGISTQDGNNYEEINFGFALGIPISTVIGVASQGQLPTSKLQVTNTLAPNLSESEGKEIQQIQLSTLSKPSQTATAKEWLDYGNLLWREDRNQEAVTAFETAIKSLERHPEIQDRKEQLRTAYFGLGLAWWNNSQGSEQHDLRAAVVAFQQAEKVDPGFYPSSRYLGSSLKKLKRYQEALTAYQRAISKQKDDFVLYVERGDVLREMERYPEAVSSYNLAVKLQPNHPWAYLNRGNAYAALKQYPQAIADFNRVIQLDPQDAKAYNNRGFAYYNLKQYPQAIADYDRAIKLDPQYTYAYVNRGVVYREQQQYPQAIADYNQAIKLNPQFAGAYYNRGVAYNLQKQYPQAIADYTQAIKLDPQLTQAYYNRGFVYNLQQQYSQAIADYNQAIKLDPQYTYAYVNRGLVYYALKQYPQAIADYNQAIKLDSQFAWAYINRGSAYDDLKQYDRAIADYNQAIKLNPQLADAYINRGFAYNLQKQYALAIADFNQAIKLNPQDAIAYNNRGFVYSELKQYPQAKADLAKAAQLFRAQNNTAGYQRAMELLQQLK